MPYVKAMQYVGAMELIKAEETLVQINVESYPHFNKDFRNKYEKSLKSVIKRYNESNSEAPKDTKELYEHLVRTLGNG